MLRDSYYHEDFDVYDPPPDYQYEDGVSYPPDHNFKVSRSPGYIVSGCQQGYIHHNQGYIPQQHYSLHQPRRNDLYGPALTRLSQQTKANLSHLKEKIILGQNEPCMEYGMEHFHTDGGKSADQCRYFEDIPDNMRPTWHNKETVFVDNKVTPIQWKRQSYTNKKGYKNNAKAKQEDTGPVNKLCYLCTTLEEHQKHLARRGLQLKPKHKPKPRVEYIPPPPMVKRKEEVPEEKGEVLYKVVVRTGKKVNAATSAKVEIKLFGHKGVVRRWPLQKKLAVNFTFGRGTTESFYHKGPEVGDIRKISIEHDGLEKHHSWYLEEVEVTKIQTDQTWVFVCNNWLSLHHGDYRVSRELRSQQRETEPREFDVTVYTAQKFGAGTDAKVYLTIYGKRGVSRKMKLQNKEKENFESGTKSKFFVVVEKDIGPITKIRIEHDNTGMGPGWLLEKVELIDQHNKKLTFPCGQWLAEDEGDGKLWRELYPVGKGAMKGLHTSPRRGKKGSDVVSGKTIPYTIKVLTGTCTHAGTDAKVYLTMFSKLGKTEEILLDEHKDHFEKGQTDVFKVRATDIGDLKKMMIRHDNTGLGSGWYLDTVAIRRYFSKDEVRERMGEGNRDGNDDDDSQRSPSRSQNKFKSASRSTMETIDEDDYTERKKRSSRFDDDDEDKWSRSSKIRFEDEDRRSRSKYDEDDRKSKSRKDKKSKKNKKTFNYNGIEVTVTDSESEDDRGKRKGGRKSNRYDSESDSDDDKRKKSKKKSKGKYDSDSDSDDYRKKHKKKSKGKYDSDSDSDDKRKKHKKKSRSKHDSDSDETVSSRKSKSRFRSARDTDSDDERRHRRSRKKRYDDSSDDDSDADSKLTTNSKGKGKMPEFDEYLFEINNWLATDEGDQQLYREAKPKSVTTFYRMK